MMVGDAKRSASIGMMVNELSPRLGTDTCSTPPYLERVAFDTITTSPAATRGKGLSGGIKKTTETETSGAGCGPEGTARTAFHETSDPAVTFGNVLSTSTPMRLMVIAVPEKALSRSATL